MAKEKISDQKKEKIDKLDISGKKVEYLADILGVSKTTIYKAKREGRLLTYIDDLKKENHDLREIIVQEQLEKLALSSKNQKKSSRHS